MRKSFEKFLARQEALARQYGEAYEEKQHNRGKLTARERIEFLFDEGTFEEVDAYSPSATTSFGKTVRSYGDGDRYLPIPRTSMFREDHWVLYTLPKL